MKLFNSWIQGLLFNLANYVKIYMAEVGPDGSRERNSWPSEGGGCSHAISFFTVKSDSILPDILGTEILVQILCVVLGFFCTSSCSSP